MDPLSLLAKYDRPVPRYTSYPTAPHFGPEVTDATYRHWLAAIPDGVPISLYLHIPFCDELCLYCGCHTAVVRRDGPRQSYAVALCREIAMVADAIGRRLPVNHIHWGGGTPTALPVRSLIEITDTLNAHFDVLPGAEIAIELDPRHLAQDRLAVFPEMGITRASLGVQDFGETVQRAIGRLQSFEMTERAAHAVRAHGVRSLNLDLMYGLPLQTLASVRETAKLAVRLRPDRAAVFGYAHVPWMKRHQELILALHCPHGAERFAQMETIAEVLTGAGYTSIGLDHYALPSDSLAMAARQGTMRRNFQGYTTDTAETLIGFGASAIGGTAQGYVQNIPQTSAYLAAIRGGNLPVHRGIALSQEDQLRRTIIMQLMCAGRVNLREICEDAGKTVSDLGASLPSLALLAQDGLVQWDGVEVTISPEANRFVRSVAAVFDKYLASGKAGHSRAV